jgi:hypothetical protein
MYDVDISQSIVSQMDEYLQSINLQPVDVKNVCCILIILQIISFNNLQTQNTDVSLLLDQRLCDFDPTETVSDGCVSWTPPKDNWNTWTGECIVNDGERVSLLTFVLQFLCSFLISLQMYPNILSCLNLLFNCKILKFCIDTNTTIN